MATKPSVIAVSGPSILGLGDDPSNDADYLLDDEPSSRSRGPIFLTLLFLAFLAGTGYFYWQRVYAPSMRVQVPALRSTPPPAFAYERTDPLVLANSQLATTTGLLDRSSLDHVRLQRIAADIKEETDAADPRKNPNLVEGEKYLYGRGVSQDCKQAIEHFKAAAKQDNAPALTHLGVMSASGRCMKRDRVQAYKWFAQAKAADPGNVWLDQSMDMLWANMSHSERTAVLK
ncbi:MAG TPA: tetratricopeptide repeat protein [Terriglobales bacterium]|nr:tetratricopeptide repeat protein [Terriglobales bacterium]